MSLFVRALYALVPAVLLIGAGWAQPLTSLPIDDVLDGPIQLHDISATSATLAVTTNIDLACVVVFGPDETFGDLALDMDMGGGAHRDHLVFLRGLTPDTDYVYRLQGSDAAGNFYASEVLHFRTAPAESDGGEGDLGTNLATLAAGAEVVEASSEFGDAFVARHAIDGDPRSEWSSRGDGDDAFITVRLASTARVTGFALWTRTMGSSAQIARFEVENEHGDVFGPFDVADATGPHVFEASGAGQVFTFRVVASSGGNTGAVEVGVFGELD